MFNVKKMLQTTFERTQSVADDPYSPLPHSITHSLSIAAFAATVCENELGIKRVSH